MSRERLPRAERLKGGVAVQRVIKTGRAVEDNLLVIRFIEEGEAGQRRRVGVAASRQFRNAVVRNRIRRRVREIYRKHRGELPPAGDFMIVAKIRAGDASYSELTASFKALADELSD